MHIYKERLIKCDKILAIDGRQMGVYSLQPFSRFENKKLRGSALRGILGGGQGARAL